MAAPPIFVVGVPRSGTTLLAALLSAHSRLAAGPETAFFASLAAAGVRRAIDAARWPRAGVDFLASSRLEGESLLERYGLDREEARRRLARRPPAASALLSLLGEAAASAAGKPRWLEKSPIHLLYARDIRRHFPHSPIVRILRDPRDVALSLAKVPWGPDDLTGGLLYWRRFHERSRGFFAEDTASYTLRYEELVARPEATLGGLCGFLGEELELGMLEGAPAPPELVRSGESWKSDAGGAVDAGRAGRWRDLEPGERRLGDAVVGDLLEELGYPLAGSTLDRGWVWVHPLHEAAAGEPRLREALAGGARLWPSPAGERPRAGLLVGDPDADDWLGRRSRERLAAALRICVRVLALRLRGRRVEWRRPAASSEQEARREPGEPRQELGREPGQGPGRERGRDLGQEPGRGPVGASGGRPGWSAGLLSLVLRPLTAGGGDR